MAKTLDTSHATSILDLPPLWGEVASLAGTVPLVDVATLAGYFKRPKKEIETILAHPLVAEHVEHLKAEISLRLGSEVNTLTEARSLAIKGIKDHLADAKDIPLSALTRVTQLLFEHHPDRRFQKVEQREQKTLVEHTIREHALDGLKARAFENFSRKQISATVSDVSASFEQIVDVSDEDVLEDFSESGMNAIEASLASQGVL